VFTRSATHRNVKGAHEYCEGGGSTSALKNCGESAPITIEA